MACRFGCYPQRTKRQNAIDTIRKEMSGGGKAAKNGYKVAAKRRTTKAERRAEREVIGAVSI
jgi:hypothetical protein